MSWTFRLEPRKRVHSKAVIAHRFVFLQGKFGHYHSEGSENEQFFSYMILCNERIEKMIRQRRSFKRIQETASVYYESCIVLLEKLPISIREKLRSILEQTTMGYLQTPKRQILTEK